MTRPKVLLTRPWPDQAQAYMQAHYDTTVNMSGRGLSKDELIAAMINYDAICPAVTDRMDSEILSVASPRVKILGNFGVGYEHIDLLSAKAAGIVVSNTPDVLTEATADIALMLMLMASRRAGEGERQLRSGGWKGWGTTALMGQSLEGKALGLVGFGRIAQATARKAKNALGMRIFYSSRRRVAVEIESEFDAVYIESLEELASSCDVMSLHIPGGDETFQLVDARLLALMKPTAILINTARGSVVDERALADALMSKNLWAAGLDVYAHEPQVYPALLDLESVVLLPHLGSATVETRNAMGLRAAANIDQFFAGEPVRDRLV